MNENMEKHIIKYLIEDNKFAEDILPLIPLQGWSTHGVSAIVKSIIDLRKDYENIDYNIIRQTIYERGDLTEDIFNDANNLLNVVKTDEYKVSDKQWLHDQTILHCENIHGHDALTAMIHKISEGKGYQNSTLELLESVEKFTSLIKTEDHNILSPENIKKYVENIDESSEHLPFDMPVLNKITNGGAKKGAVHIFLAATGIGKSAILSSLAVDHVLQGYNVLFISTEMSSKDIQKRMYAKIFNTPMYEHKNIEGDFAIEQSSKIQGYLIVREFQSYSASCNDFNKLIAKHRPDIVYIDYLDTCTPIKSTRNDHGWVKLQTVGYEMNSLATRYDIPVMTAMQTNREGQSKKPTIESMSGSLGPGRAAQHIVGLYSNESLRNNNKMTLVQLKNRNRSMTEPKEWDICCDFSLNKFEEIPNSERSSQDNIEVINKSIQESRDQINSLLPQLDTEYV